MESPILWESLPNNRIKAIQELTRGEEWANKLRDVLQWSGKTEPDPTSLDVVVVNILRMFENTLTIMGSCSVNEPLKVPTCDSPSSCNLDGRKLDNSNDITPMKLQRGCYKRKNSWTSTKVTSVLINDPHTWRKYGQKEITNSKHPRSYYRCSYKFDQGCQATKQVQQIEDKPPKYKITYFGHHTCNNLQLPSPIILESRDHGDTSILLNFEKGVAEKKQVDHEHAYQTSDRFTHDSLVLPSESGSGFDHANMIPRGVYLEMNHGDMASSSSQVYEMGQLFGMIE